MSTTSKSGPKRTVPVGPPYTLDRNVPAPVGNSEEAAERTRRLVRNLSPKVPILLKKILMSKKVSDEIKTKAILMILDWVLGLPEAEIEVQAELPNQESDGRPDGEVGSGFSEEQAAGDVDFGFNGERSDDEVGFGFSEEQADGDMDFGFNGERSDDEAGSGFSDGRADGETGNGF